MRKKLKLPRETLRQLTPLPDSELNRVNGGVLPSFKENGGVWCSTIYNSHCCTNLSGCN